MEGVAPRATGGGVATEAVAGEKDSTQGAAEEPPANQTTPEVLFHQGLDYSFRLHRVVQTQG